MIQLSTLSEKQVAACKKLKNCKPFSWRYKAVVQEFLDCCWLKFERDLYVAKAICQNKKTVIALLAKHYGIRLADCSRILKLKNFDLLVSSQEKSSKNKMNNHPLNKHLSVLGSDQVKVAKSLRDSSACNYESSLEEFDFYCKHLFLRDLEVLNALYQNSYGSKISASLAATILADYYNVKLKDSCYILAREGKCSPNLYQRILDKLNREKTGIQTLIFASRTECQKMLNAMKKKKTVLELTMKTS